MSDVLKQNQELPVEIAKAVGVDVGVVASVLVELANQAYLGAPTGFVLPGFGTFQIVDGAETTGTNPFTGKPTVFRAPPEVEFIIDTAARDSFIAGGSGTSEAISGAKEPATLRPVWLAPIAEDLAAVELESERTCKFKVGGEPDWLQAPRVPVCCGEPMLFYGQLDSLDTGDYSIGDVGMIYVFFCLSCCATRSIIQF